MKIAIVFENNSKRDYEKGWGFSALVKKIKKYPIQKVFPMHCTGEIGIQLLKHFFPVMELSTGDIINQGCCVVK